MSFGGFVTLAIVFGTAVASGRSVAGAFLAAMAATEAFDLSLGIRAVAPRVEATMWLYLTALPVVAILAVAVGWLVR